MLPDSFQTVRLLLRLIAVEDAEVIFDTYAQDKEVARYVIWRPHNHLNETQAYIAHCVVTPHESSAPTCWQATMTISSGARSRCASKRHTVWTVATCWPAVGGGKA